ncbi:MAG: copper resistance protein CopC, partial [Chloroflexi bacterium]|nr:copper resistance protein CopC [Chloroflexota bacterium]
MKRCRAINLAVLVALATIISIGWLLFGPSGEVSAHANVATSEPPANAVLDEPPDQIVIWFTEPLEPALSQIQVLNSQGSRVDNDDSLIDRIDPSVMSVTLRGVENETYTVVWKNVSTVDGHRVRGSYIFSVGEPLSGAAPVETPEQGLLQSPSEPVIRWLVLLGGLVLVGGFGFHLYVLRPVLTAKDASPDFGNLVPQAEILVSRLMLLAVVVAVLASVAQLIVQASVVHDISVVASLGDPIKTILTDTDWGRVWLWRMGTLAAALVVVVSIAVLAQRRQQGVVAWLYLPVIAISLGAGMLFTISWTSHGAATADIETPSIISDFIHLLASSFWAGGILVFLAAIILISRGPSSEHRSTIFAALTPKFSAIAVISMGILIVTGAYGAWAQVTIIEAFATPYGWTLVGKLGLVVVILAIGAFNLLWIKKRLASTPNASSWLARLIAVEAVFAVLIVVAVGVLTSLEPARQVASREGIGVADELRFNDTAEGVEIDLAVVPGRVGTNRFLVSLVDRFGNSVPDAEEVSIDLTSLDVDLGKTTFVTENLGGGRYAVEEALFNVAGAWQASVIVRRSDAFDARTAFRFIAAKTSA